MFPPAQSKMSRGSSAFDGSFTTLGVNRAWRKQHHQQSNTVSSHYKDQSTMVWGRFKINIKLLSTTINDNTSLSNCWTSSSHTVLKHHWIETPKAVNCKRCSRLSKAPETIGCAYPPRSEACWKPPLLSTNVCQGFQRVACFLLLFDYWAKQTTLPTLKSITLEPPKPFGRLTTRSNLCPRPSRFISASRWLCWETSGVLQRLQPKKRPGGWALGALG